MFCRVPAGRATRGVPSVTDLLESGTCQGDDDTLEFFHATRTKNIPRILANGLVGNRGVGGTFANERLHWENPRIFLAAGYEAAELWRGMVEEQTGEPTSLLTVRLPPALRKRLRLDEIAHYEGITCSFWLDRPVLAKYIKVDTYYDVLTQ